MSDYLTEAAVRERVEKGEQILSTWIRDRRTIQFLGDTDDQHEIGFHTLNALREDGSIQRIFGPTIGCGSRGLTVRIFGYAKPTKSSS